MKAPLLSESLIISSAFCVLILFSIESCQNKERVDNQNKNEVFGNNTQEEIEAHFFIGIANVSKKMISKSQIAQQQGLHSKVKELSKKIENEQYNVLQNITKIANKKLIIITEINAAGNQDLYELMKADKSNFDKIYLNDMTDSLAEEIGLLEKITKDTKDVGILKLANAFLPKHYQLLRETEKLKREIN